ncbi:MAG: WD40 domain-containing protein [Ignavibacteria bacterium]|nr:MAG: WD40 domain-containing protein [Ignavibacteria bacterium]KAF0161986.1 MAG: WD40 domain-containing protein [Ignavibacteria bacterium]
MRKLILIFFLSLTPLIAQYNEYNPDYTWLTIKGKYVRVHYHEEAERTARVVAKIADEIWEPITSLYQYEPETVDYIIKDIDDFSNGATFFFDNKIEIWASSLDFDLRGTHNWLRNVIAHEFTHMVQLQAGMKVARTLPVFYLQFLNYEDKRRPDILYGFPNFIASYPIPGINVPSWFAEGTAQYMRKEFGYDDWDTHRDMILRSYALENKMLTWNQMGVFEKNSLGNESVYNSGFALTNYIAQKYGEDKLREISKKLGKLTIFTIDDAFEEVLGKSGNQIYDEWSNFLKEDYKKRTEAVLTNNIKGEMIASVGFGNFHPVFSSDGSKMLYISNKTNDYMSLSSLFLYDFKTKTEKRVKTKVRSTAAFVPGTNKVVYAKLSDENPKWVSIHDLYIYDLDSEKETRLTNGLRANNPTVSNDGKKIAFIFQKDGTVNLGTVDIDGKNFKRLTFFENGEQLYNPKFTADDSQIYFDFSIKENRDIAKINVDGSAYELVTTSEADERNPFLTKDSKLYYSSDESGIFNIYSVELKTKLKRQLTNVTGGALMPSINDKGEIVYSGYTADGYKIFLIKPDEQYKVDSAKKYISLNNPPLDTEKPNGDIGKFNIAALRNYDDSKTPEYSIEKYSGFFSKLSVLPFIRYDNYSTFNSGLDRIKPGLYVASSDILNRYSIFGSASINRKLERDLFLQFAYRDKLPLLYNLGLHPEIGLELYSVSRGTNIDLNFGIDSTFIPPRIDYKIPAEVFYSLFEFNIVAKHKLFSDATMLEGRFIFSQYSSELGSFIIPESNNTLYPTSSDKYYIGRGLQLKFTHEQIIPTIDSDINPVGRKIELKFDYEFNRFNNENNYVVVDGILKPLYNDFRFPKLELNWKEFISLGRNHTFNAQIRAGAIFGPQVPDFFDFYLGGLIGMKSYPFYSVSGNEIGWLNLTYRFPLFKNIDTRLGHLYLDKIYFSVYADYGNAWNGAFPKMKDFKKGIGGELRIKLNSFYIFPTSLFFNAAYSFDEFGKTVRGEVIKYGKEWNFYGGILFDFSF